ncbi:MAG: lysylphosphatidylglycerol synthase transmembrane domain-containing protein, partial [Solirubrobacterales bacterium]
GGMERRDVGTRMVAFIVLHYLFYPLAIIVCGVLLRTGVLHGSTEVSLTIVPAAIAGLVMIIGLTIALVPGDIERRVRNLSARRPTVKFLAKLATVPATLAEGVRVALKLVAHPTRAGLAIIGAIGFWAANVGILWASFKAFGIAIPFGVVVMGFFIGMAANLIPFVPAGVGAVDAGMIGTFVLFGFPESEVFAAVLIYRLVAFWLPIPTGVIAFFQLRKTIKRWKTDGLPVDRAPQPMLIKTGT